MHRLFIPFGPPGCFISRTVRVLLAGSRYPARNIYCTMFLSMENIRIGNKISYVDQGVSSRTANLSRDEGKGKARPNTFRRRLCIFRLFAVLLPRNREARPERRNCVVRLTCKGASYRLLIRTYHQPRFFTIWTGGKCGLTAFFRNFPSGCMSATIHILQRGK